MTTVISSINLKGGVGKTTITVALGEFLAMEHNKRVLIIDLDPQTNATVTLIDEENWAKRDRDGRTLLRLFKDRVEKKSEFDLSKTIIKSASKVGNGIQNLDLLPSSLGLIEIQDQLPMIPSGNFFMTSPVSILFDAVSGVLNQYDYVLIDCPPNLGIITLNGINFSDYFLIPVIPDILSTYGIPQILSRMESFRREKKSKSPMPLGIVISMFRSQSTLHSTVIRDLKNKASNGTYPRTFDTFIPLTTKTADASDFSAPANTLKQKYGYGKSYENFSKLTNELLTYV
jgi:chromosome partitioning protein